jgi:Mycothiol maleylpyruvate isomerase N-terminal domain
MYPDALSFLEDERDGWRPYEGLADLDDAQLSTPLEAAHGWSGRDLMAHLAACLELCLEVARELAMGETSPAKVAADADWDARGDEINEEIRLAWRALPMDEVRRRFTTVPGELRGYLTVVPETRWLKNADYEEFFLSETIDHYEDHLVDLAVVLAAAGRG